MTDTTTEDTNIKIDRVQANINEDFKLSLENARKRAAELDGEDGNLVMFLNEVEREMLILIEAIGDLTNYANINDATIGSAIDLIAALNTVFSFDSLAARAEEEGVPEALVAGDRFMALNRYRVAWSQKMMADVDTEADEVTE